MGKVQSWQGDLAAYNAAVKNPNIVYYVDGVGIFRGSVLIVRGDNAVKLDGTGAYGTWGINITGSSTLWNGNAFSDYLNQGVRTVDAPYFTAIITANIGRFATLGGTYEAAQAAVELREYQRGSLSVTHTEQYAPRLGFHWGERYWANLIYFNNAFLFKDGGDSSIYRPVVASDFVKANSSDSYLLLGGGGHKLISDFVTLNPSYMSAGQDLNTQSAGVYPTGGNAILNAPGNQIYGTAFTISTAAYYGWQMYEDYDGQLHTRANAAGTWLPWRLIYDSANSNKSDVNWTANIMYANALVMGNAGFEMSGDTNWAHVRGSGLSPRTDSVQSIGLSGYRFLNGWVNNVYSDYLSSKQLMLNVGTTYSANLAGQPAGSIHVCNVNSSGYSMPAIIGKTTDNYSGLYLMGMSNDSNTNYDMMFNVRKTDNTDFATLTGKKAFSFYRFGTELASLYRDGIFTTTNRVECIAIRIKNSTGQYVDVTVDTSGRLVVNSDMYATGSIGAYGIG